MGREVLGVNEAAGSSVSAAQPLLGIEFGGFLAQLEVEGTVAGGVGGYGAQYLAGRHFLAAAHGSRGEVAVDRHVGTVAHNDVVHAAIGEYAGHFALEDSAGLGPGGRGDVDTLAVELHAVEAVDVVLPVVWVVMA